MIYGLDHDFQNANIHGAVVAKGSPELNTHNLFDAFLSRDIADALGSLNLPTSGTKPVRIQRLIQNERSVIQLINAFPTEAIRRACASLDVPVGDKEEMVSGLLKGLDTPKAIFGRWRVTKFWAVVGTAAIVIITTILVGVVTLASREGNSRGSPAPTTVQETIQEFGTDMGITVDQVLMTSSEIISPSTQTRILRELLDNWSVVLGTGDTFYQRT